MINRIFIPGNQERPQLDYMTVEACGKKAKVIYYVSVDTRNFNIVWNYTALWPWDTWTTGQISQAKYDIENFKSQITETISAEIAVNTYRPTPQYKEAQIYVK